MVYHLGEVSGDVPHAARRAAGIEGTPGNVSWVHISCAFLRKDRMSL